MIRGKRRELGLGSADLVRLTEARDAALANRRMARAGGDPLQARRAALAVPTFAEAARRVHEMHRPTWRSAKHALGFLSALEIHAFPRIGDVKVSDIDASDLLNVLSPIWTTKPATARQVRQRIGTVLKWAIAQGWRLDDPTATITQALPRNDGTWGRRKALPYAEVAGCLEAIKASGASWSVKLALELLVLTAGRSGEVRLAQWDEVDLAAEVWEIPAARDEDEASASHSAGSAGDRNPRGGEGGR